MILDPIKHVLRVFLNGLKNINGKACVKRVYYEGYTKNVQNFTALNF